MCASMCARVYVCLCELACEYICMCVYELLLYVVVFHSRPLSLVMTDRCMCCWCVLQVWTLSVLYLLVAILLMGISFFLPAILASMGYTPLTSNLISTPIYLIAAAVTIGVAWSSDRRRERFWHCIVPAVITGVFFLLFALSLTYRSLTWQLITLTVLVANTWCVCALCGGVVRFAF
jgi:hypothetical protein